MAKVQSRKKLLSSSPPKKRTRKKVVQYTSGPNGAPVNSKIENTKVSVPKIDNSSIKKSISMKQYRKGVKELGIHLSEEAIKESGNNLLSAKLGLWEAIRVVEDKMRSNKE